MIRKSQFIFFFLVLFLFLGAQPVSGWWDTNWAYRQRVEIAGNGNNSVSNYQMLLNIYNVSDSSSGNSLYSDNILFPDFSDIRIIASDDITPLNYWINETWNNHCDLWVKIPTIDKNAGTTIYIYYNYFEASSVTDGYSTFDFYDNFEGAAVNNTQWVDSTSDGGTITVSNSIIDLEGPGGEGRARIYSIRTFLLKSGKRMMWRSATDNKWTLFEGMQQMGDEVLYFEDSAHRVISYHSCGGADYDFDSVTAITHGVYSLRQFTENISSDNCGDKRFQVSQNNIVEVSKNEDDTVGNANMFINYDVYASGGFIKLDWVFIGNYDYPEPFFDVWYSEESTSTSTPTPLPSEINPHVISKGKTFIYWGWNETGINYIYLDGILVNLNNGTYIYSNLVPNTKHILTLSYDGINETSSIVFTDKEYTYDIWLVPLIGLILIFGFKLSPISPFFGFLIILINLVTNLNQFNDIEKIVNILFIITGILLFKFKFGDI